MILHSNQERKPYFSKVYYPQNMKEDIQKWELEEGVEYDEK